MVQNLRKEREENGLRPVWGEVDNSEIYCQTSLIPIDMVYRILVLGSG